MNRFAHITYISIIIFLISLQFSEAARYSKFEPLLGLIQPLSDAIYSSNNDIRIDPDKSQVKTKFLTYGVVKDKTTSELKALLEPLGEGTAIIHIQSGGTQVSRAQLNQGRVIEKDYLAAAGVPSASMALVSEHIIASGSHWYMDFREL